MNRLRHRLDDLTRVAPYLLAATATTIAAAVWHWGFGLPLIHFAVLILAALAAIQEARILSLNARLENHLADHAPEHDDETPWRDGAGLDEHTLNALDEMADGVRPIDGPRPSPRPRTEPFEDWLARATAEHEAAMARISGDTEEQG